MNATCRPLQRQRRLERHSDETDTLADVLTCLISTGADPSQAAEFNDQVEHLCATLNEVEQRLLEVRMQGYSPAEVADELGLSAVATRVRLTRLRQRLRSSGVLDDWL